MIFDHTSIQDSRVLAIPAMGLELRVRVPAEAPENTLIVFETVNAPGFGPPLHRHTETEIFRVLEGTYLYEVEGRRFEAVAGDIITVPGGMAHTFLNTGNEPAKQFVMMLPAMDAYRFFSDLADLMAARRPSLSELNEFGKAWRVEFLGPPIAVNI